MARINTILLFAILLVACLKPAAQREIVPVNIPPAPCETPFPPEPPTFSARPYDCDGGGPETKICMEEMDFVLMVVWMKKWIAWSAIIEKCPSIKFSNDWKIIPPKVVQVPTQVDRI